MTLYHATTEEGFVSICESQCIKPRFSDKTVYLAKSPISAIRFVAHRVPITEDLYVFEVDIPDSNVFETFDHNPSFFKCRSYGYKGSIGTGMCTGCIKYPGIKVEYK